MSTVLEDTGERMIPELHKGRNMYGAHIGRYQAGMSVVEGKVVLDIACGSGYGTKLMAAAAKKVYGVDIDKDTISYAKEKYSADNISYLLGSGTEIPLEDNSVDVVVSYETIEHIEDYETFMKEVKRVLRPDGLFLLSTPNDVEYMEGNHYHVHEFNYEELKSLVKKYFKFHEDYFQTLWMYSSILPKNLHTSEWQQRLETTSTIPLDPDKCIYFFLLCSNKKIEEKIEPLGVMGEHYRQRALQEENHKRNKVIQDSAKKAKEQQAKLINENQHLRSSAKHLKDLNDAILGSESYKIGRVLVLPVSVLKAGLRSIISKLS